MGKSVLCRAIACYRADGFVIDSMNDFGLGTPVNRYSELPYIGDGGWYSMPILSYRGEEEAAVRIALTSVYNAGADGLLPKPYAVVVEEADMYGGASWNMEALKKLSNVGQRWGISLVVNAHDMASCPKVYFTNAHVVLYGRTANHLDLKRIKPMLDEKTFSIYGKLDEYHFLAVDIMGNLADVAVLYNRRTRKPERLLVNILEE